MRVLVTGATGFIGQAVVRALLEAGFFVRILTRRHSSVFEDHPNLEQIEGDMTDVASLLKACEGIDRVVHLAARKSDEKDSVAVNIEGAKALRDACEKTGVRQILHLSTQSTKLTRRGVYGETKKQAEAILQESSVPVLTLRSSLVYGGDASGVFQTILTYAKLPVIPVIGDGHYRFRPIHRDDLAGIITCAIKQPPRSGIYDIGGPDIVSFDDIVHRILALKHVQKPLVHLPIWFALFIAKFGLLLPKSPLTVSNVLGSAEDVPMDIEPQRRDFPVKLRTFEQGLREALETETQDHTDATEEEALLLLRYVRSATGGWNPSKADADQYRQALQAHGIPPSSTLTARGRKWIAGLDALTRLRHPECVLRQKLLVACAIAECHPASAEALLPKDRTVLSFLALCTRFTIRSIAKLLSACLLLPFPSFIKRNVS